MDDYKNSKEGRIVAAKYADILHKSRPEPSFKHPRMSLSNRAKIFSPFAALRGYEEEIADEKWKQMRVSKSNRSIIPRTAKEKSPGNGAREGGEII